MKFLVDRCAGVTLAQWLRKQGHDVREACAESRILVTLDKDFGALLFERGLRHCGLVRLPDLPAASRIELFERLLARHAKDMSDGAVLTVRGDRIRVSR